MLGIMPYDSEAEKEPLSPYSSDPEEEAATFPLTSRREHFYSGGIFHWLLHVASFLCIVTLLVRSQSTVLCNKAVQSENQDGYTPILEGISHEQRKVFFEGGFDGWTPFSGPPTDAVMEAWWSLEDMPYVNLTAEQMIKMGRSLNSVQFPKEMGGGYLGTAEGPHNLHCLNILWRDHYIDQLEDVIQMKADMPHLYEKYADYPPDL